MMKICGRDYKLTLVKGHKGAEFYCNGKETTCRGEIIIGDYQDLRGICEILIHEALEAILCEDCKRYYQTSHEACNERYLFMFDHDYLDGLCPKLLDALLTSDLFKLTDNRKQYRKPLKKKEKPK
jgi:hypothetical protein